MWQYVLFELLLSKNVSYLENRPCVVDTLHLPASESIKNFFCPEYLVMQLSGSL